jgi:hypothetical protein
MLAFPTVGIAGRRIQRCSSTSSFYCVDRTVGGSCGGRCKCEPRDRKDKSEVVDCVCRCHGPHRRR